ncbi:MAG TPA: transglycosylase domain-containing protein [Acidimicrobiales bacterium]|nr:transglycosylase domain-containing protein [Acidimicrobiales bacterium]
MVRALRAVAAFAIVSVVTPITCVVVVIGALIFLPLPATLPKPKPILESDVTHVVDKDGNEIGVFKQYETYIKASPSDIPQVLKDAVVSSEDKHFYDHGGVDVPSTLRALWADVQNKKVEQGGSTITQQYVKNAFTNGDRTIARKIREAILASQLERAENKDTILYNYLDTIYFGEGAYGIVAAAQTYFRTPVAQLSLSQAALLAGVIPAPSNYSPRVNAVLADQRRVLVLDLMLQQARITKAQHDDAVAHHVWLTYTGDAPGPATLVYPPQQQQSSQPWFTQYVKDWLEAHLPGCVPNNCPLLDKGGLTVTTTLDSKVQMEAEDEVAKSMGNNDPNLQMALVAVEPPTGYVRAMVGGRQFNADNQYNDAIGSPGRQPGSSFKPFVLATAFEEGIQPTKTYSGATFTAPNGDQIHNVEGEGAGPFDLRSATVHSVNAVFARLILDVGVDKAMAMAQRLGLDMPPYDPNKYGASVALGAIEAKPLQMASAYGVFANHGRRAPPTPVLRVTDASGKVILDNTNAADKAQPVVSDVVADNVTDILTGVLISGTAAGKGLANDRPAAGKTGTAEGNGNAWFVGYTPTLSTAVWMGYQNCNCPMHNINGVGQVFGGTIPASTWQHFMNRALDGVAVTEFSQPAPIQTFADDARRAARHGFDAGPRRYPSGPPGGGPYEVDVTPPDATAPTTTTTSTTSTTVPKPPTTIVGN